MSSDEVIDQIVERTLDHHNTLIDAGVSQEIAVRLTENFHHILCEFTLGALVGLQPVYTTVHD